MMLTSLNDDCLLYICELLSYFDQSSLAHTCQRLQHIVENNWRYKAKIVVVDREQCSYFAGKEINPEHFVKFMKCISTNVEDLTLECIERKIVYALKEIRFPKVTRLVIDLHYYEDDDDDEITALIAKLFPHITKLSIKSGMTGKHLWDLTNLTELDVGGCESLDTQHFKRIFSSLQLKKLNIMFHGYNVCFNELVADIVECVTLEELHIDDHHLVKFVDQLPKLNKLHKLVTYIRDCETLLEKIVNQCGDTIDTMIFNEAFDIDEDHFKDIGNMHNLRRLIIYDDHINSKHLKFIAKKLESTLEEFRYINGINFSMCQDGLIELTTHCKFLKILDISRNKFDVNFLRKIVKHVNSLKNRRDPLTIRCFNTAVTEEDAEILTIPNIVEIKLSKEEITFPASCCFQIEWK